MFFIFLIFQYIYRVSSPCIFHLCSFFQLVLENFAVRRLQERWDSNRLIEEFMLLANMAVARRIHAAFPTLALLRRHPPPKVT
jgi:hypothetical protein